MSSTRHPFFCTLCNKGYSRLSELDTHESSYDHHHRKRAKDLREASRDPKRHDRNSAADMSRLVEGENKKVQAKRGFRSAFGSSEQRQDGEIEQSAVIQTEHKVAADDKSTVDDSGLYDPRHPTLGWDM